MVTRRTFLRAAGAGAGAVLLGGAPRVLAEPPPPPGTAQTTTLAPQPAVGTGQYLYFPFVVPDGVNRVAVRVASNTGAKLGAGLFDHRGAGYQSAGFRGVYGEERSEFSVAAHEASQSFLPGPVEAGTWTVVVPVFQAPPRTVVTPTVTLTFGPELAAFVPGPECGVVRDEPGWYRGDLHCHTPESSDAWRSGSALTPAAWAAEARRLGMDFLAMTDHNVVTQNLDLAAAAGEGVLLLPGEEMTNWFHGHATVSGIEVGDWLDWRQRPFGVALGPEERRVGDFLAVVREMGAYVSAAHPLSPLPGLPWQFFADDAADPSGASLPHGLEVWTGQFQPDDELALRRWDELLQRGRRVFANGGSDLHGVENGQGFAAGTPTTVVYAERLEKRAVVDGLRRGRSFVTRRPDGVDVFLSATGPGGQEAIPGGEIRGRQGQVAEVRALVRRAAGMRFVLVADGAVVSTTVLRGDDQEVGAALPLGRDGYVRAEVRSRSEVDPANPVAGRLDMEAFTNPVFLVAGAPQGEPGRDEAPPPPPPPPAPGRPAGGLLPATSAVLAVGALRPVALAPVLLVGRVAAVDAGARVLTVEHLVAGCAGHDHEGTALALAHLPGGTPVPAVGATVQVRGSWRSSTAVPPELEATSVEVAEGDILSVTRERRWSS